MSEPEPAPTRNTSRQKGAYLATLSLKRFTIEVLRFMSEPEGGS